MKLCAHKDCQREAEYFLYVRCFKFPVCKEHKDIPEGQEAFSQWPGPQPIAVSEQEAEEEVCPIILRPKDFISPKCKHQQVLVDDELRTIECAKCGQALDPVQCLIEIAHGFRSIDYKLQAMADFERKKIEQRERDQQREFKRKLKRANIKPIK